MAENTYVIPLGKVWRKPWNKRERAALRFIRKYVERHVKAKIVLIGVELNELILSGIPRKVKVKVKKEGEKAWVTTLEGTFEKAKSVKEEKKPEKKEEPTGEKKEETPEELKEKKKAVEAQKKAAVMEG
jgi:large subunit ribosomal protein L31e